MRGGGGGRRIVPLSTNRWTRWVSGTRHAATASHPGKQPLEPTDNRTCGPHIGSVFSDKAKHLLSPCWKQNRGFSTAQLTVQSLYRARYPDHTKHKFAQIFEQLQIPNSTEICFTVSEKKQADWYRWSPIMHSFYELRTLVSAQRRHNSDQSDAKGKFKYFSSTFFPPHIFLANTHNSNSHAKQARVI
jgi:hypothetical protein